MLLFQLMLWALLFAPFAGMVFGPDAAIAAMFILFCAAIYRTLSFGKESLPARVMCVAYLLISIQLFLATTYGSSMFLIAGGVLVVMLALFAYLYFFHRRTDAKVLGYDNGYAIVEVGPSIVSFVKAGVYAVRSKSVRKGQKVRVRFDLFTKKAVLISE
ncbi:hypothetical protein HZC09_04485 [Candidatus Micrarchaeota archaeon]|nr:hypothetical protein [Candidatus Micrarchaeota archaeon]